MTKIIGLTGGIGSGKSTVAEYFKSQGVPVYIADDAGRRMLEDPGIIKKVVGVFGTKLLSGQFIDRTQLARIVFTDPAALAKLNAIIHPAVREDFSNWLQSQEEPFVIREAAILFESGSHADCDKVILVTTPVEIRIARVMERDKISREDVLARMAHQWDDEKKARLSDFIIVNLEIDSTFKQCAKILKKLRNL